MGGDYIIISIVETILLYLLGNAVLCEKNVCQRKRLLYKPIIYCESYVMVLFLFGMYD